MRIDFRSKLLEDLYAGEKVKDKEFRSNPSLIKQYIKVVNRLKEISKIEDLYPINSLNYEKLKGKLKGKSSVRINQQYRLIFEEIYSENEPFEVNLLELEEISKHYE
jgi:proteic killer suppression protein